MNLHFLGLLVNLVNITYPQTSAYCDERRVSELQQRIALYDLRAGSFEASKVAQLSLDLAKTLYSCYESGKMGGPHSGVTPLADAVDAANFAITAAEDWRKDRKPHQACEAYERAASYYASIRRDSHSYKPTVYNHMIKVNAEQGERRLRGRRKHFCGS